MNLYADSTVPEEQVQRYVYARVAAGYWASAKAAKPLEGFDATALQEMEKNLSAADRSRAEAEAGEDRRTDAEAQRAFRRGAARGVWPWQRRRARRVGGWQADYRHECQWNLKNNCRGAQRITYVELTNKNAEFVSCKIEMRARDFVTGAPVIRALVAPGVDRSTGHSQPAAG